MRVRRQGPWRAGSLPRVFRSLGSSRAPAPAWIMATQPAAVRAEPADAGRDPLVPLPGPWATAPTVAPRPAARRRARDRNRGRARAAASLVGVTALRSGDLAKQRAGWTGHDRTGRDRSGVASPEGYRTAAERGPAVRERCRRRPAGRRAGGVRRGDARGGVRGRMAGRTAPPGRKRGSASRKRIPLAAGRTGRTTAPTPPTRPAAHVSSPPEMRRAPPRSAGRGFTTGVSVFILGWSPMEIPEDGFPGERGHGLHPANSGPYVEKAATRSSVRFAAFSCHPIRGCLDPCFSTPVHSTRSISTSTT